MDRDRVNRRTGQLPPHIGDELVIARANDVPWKTLEWRHGYGRTQLWKLWRAAMTRKRMWVHTNEPGILSISEHSRAASEHPIG